MKLFLKILQYVGIAVVLYPIGLILAYFDSNGNIGDWFWLEILIVDIVIGLLLFLFVDFKLVEKIKHSKRM